MLRFLNAAQTEIRYSAASVAEIVQRHGRSLAFLQECAAHCEEGEDFHTAWKKGVQAGSKGTGLTEADRLLLSDFGDGFGASDVEASFRIAACIRNFSATGWRMRDQKRLEKESYT